MGEKCSAYVNKKMKKYGSKAPARLVLGEMYWCLQIEMHQKIRWNGGWIKDG